MKKNGKKLRCKKCNKQFYIPKSRLKRKFCSRNCRKNGYIRKDGYKMITVDGKQILEHRYIMEKHLQRKLKKYEICHHLDNNKLNNKIDNLILVNYSEHKKIHWEVGLRTQFTRQYNYNNDEVLKLYKKYKNVKGVANKLGCSEITIRRLLKKSTNKSLTELAQKYNWKYNWRHK